MNVLQMSLQIYVNFSGIGSSVKKSLEGIIRKKKTNTVRTLMSTYWLICTVNYIFLFFSHLNIMSLREKKVENELF